MILSKREHAFFTELEKFLNNYNVIICAAEKDRLLEGIFRDNGKFKKINFTVVASDIYFGDEEAQLSRRLSDCEPFQLRGVR